MHSSNKDMSVITQCPLSFHGLNSLLLCTTSTNSASFSLHIHDKNRLCYNGLRNTLFSKTRFKPVKLGLQSRLSKQINSIDGVPC